MPTLIAPCWALPESWPIVTLPFALWSNSLCLIHSYHGWPLIFLCFKSIKKLHSEHWWCFGSVTGERFSCAAFGSLAGFGPHTASGDNVGAFAKPTGTFISLATSDPFSIQEIFYIQNNDSFGSGIILEALDMSNFPTLLGGILVLGVVTDGPLSL